MIKKTYIKKIVAPSKGDEKWFDFFEFILHNCTDDEVEHYANLFDALYDYEYELVEKYNIDYSIFENQYII